MNFVSPASMMVQPLAICMFSRFRTGEVSFEVQLGSSSSSTGRASLTAVCAPAAQMPQQPAPPSPAANPAAASYGAASYGAASPTSGGRVAEWLRPAAAAAQTPSPVRGSAAHGPGSGKKKLSELVTDIDTI